jgi:predicted O-methyltransferase YrrM
MRLSLTRTVPKRPVPGQWAVGPIQPVIEEVLGGLTNRWSISPETGSVLVRIVIREQRRSILEFGAGMSSRLLAAALEEIGGGRLTSVEENPAWCEVAWEKVEQTRDTDTALIPASIRLKVDCNGIYYGYEQLAAIKQRGPYDLVFVDAPWGGYGRDGALHSVIGSIVTGGLIVLDDAARIGEQRVLRRWLLRYPNLSLVANDDSVGRGVAVLRKEQDSSGHRIGCGSLAEIWGSRLYETIRMARPIKQHRLNERNLDPAK